VPIMRTKHRLRGFARCAALACLAVAACGSPYGARPECRAAYDACVNNCAEACEQGAARASTTGAGDTTNTWDGRCGECIERCKHLLRDCGR
jgi:hypothetical protein